MKHAKTTRLPELNQPNAPLLSVADVAKRLSVSEKTIRRLIKSGALAKIEIGRCLRVSEDSLQAYLTGRQ